MAKKTRKRTYIKTKEEITTAKIKNVSMLRIGLQRFANMIQAMDMLKAAVKKKLGTRSTFNNMLFFMLAKDMDYFTLDDVCFYNTLSTNHSARTFVWEMRKLGYMLPVTLNKSPRKYALTYEGKELAEWMLKQLMLQTRRGSRLPPTLEKQVNLRRKAAKKEIKTKSSI